LFTEGYTASTGEVMVKRDICYEAIRLALLLTENESTNISEVHALIALMCFHTSRFDARANEHGDLVDLEHQDRSKYNQELIRSGMQHFQIAQNKTSNNPLYYLQSAVSYYYCEAQSFEAINWKGILDIYDVQLRYSYSPIIRLNRVVPLYKVEGAKKGLQVLEELYTDANLENNVLYYSLKAQLLQELAQHEKAKETYNTAISLTKNEIQKRHLIKKRNEIA
jgi:RNA polymerase sigma-70 factor (ECF subfamily)